MLPTPAPTPTPDPWAGKFNPGGPYVSYSDFAKGPWVYKDATLSITIRVLTGPRNRPYYMAEVYSRGPIFYGGFAHQDDKERKPELPYRIARRYGAVLGFTADYLALKRNPKGVMIRNGKVYYDGTKADTLAVMPDGNLQVFTAGEVNAKQLLAMGIKDSFAFGPTVVKDGKMTDAVMTHRLRPSNYRVAIGQVEKGHYICIASSAGFTLKELAQICISNKCTLAYNLDGGHSACMIFMGEQLNRLPLHSVARIRQRALPDLVLLGFCPAVPGPMAPFYNNGADTIAKNEPKPTDGPIG